MNCQNGLPSSTYLRLHRKELSDPATQPQAENCFIE